MSTATIAVDIYTNRILLMINEEDPSIPPIFNSAIIKVDSSVLPKAWSTSNYLSVEAWAINYRLVWDPTPKIVLAENEKAYVRSNSDIIKDFINKTKLQVQQKILGTPTEAMILTMRKVEASIFIANGYKISSIEKKLPLLHKEQAIKSDISINEIADNCIAEYTKRIEEWLEVEAKLDCLIQEVNENPTSVWEKTSKIRLKYV